MAWAEEQDWFGLKDNLDFTEGTLNFAEYLNSKNEIEAKYKYDELTGEILWETKTLDLIPISQMTTQHIQNAMRMCIKNNWRTEYIQIFQLELDKRNKEK
jgi:hypothetical protein